MVSNEYPEPDGDRGNLADINWADVHLPDDDLWLLLTGQPTPPQFDAGDKVSPSWVAWAKETILDVSFVPARNERNEGLGRDDALALYMCRLMRIVDVMAESAGPPGRPSVDLENLLSSAADVAGLNVDLRRMEGSWEGADDILRHACEAGLVQTVKAGSGLTLYSLTLLGRRKADGGSVPPPYRWSAQQALDAAQADVEPSGPAESQPPPAENAPPPRLCSPRSRVAGPADDETAARTSAAAEPSTKDGDHATPTTGVTWQEVQGKLLALCESGKPFPTFAYLAELMHCSVATIHKAVRNSPNLKRWQGQGSQRAKSQSSSPKMRSLNEVDLDRRASQRESDPVEAAVDNEALRQADSYSAEPSDVSVFDDAEAALARLTEQAPPRMRAAINALPEAQRRLLGQTYVAMSERDRRQFRDGAANSSDGGRELIDLILEQAKDPDMRHKPL